ncbi:MAG TPA: pilus assembly protein N-terminal domain-containing protein [Polyangiales bacterium]|nr:pilus assembly protein N-terminal domain-containing protein [Polyangiales bacterium]
MIIRTLYCLCLLGYANAASAQETRSLTTDTQELNLSVGENRAISAQNVKSYSEGNEGVVEVRLTPEGSEFVIVGKKPGSATLLLLMRNGKQTLFAISVFARPMEVVGRELTELLGDDTGLRIRRVGPRYYIEGGVDSEADQARIAQIAKLFPGQVESLVVLGGSAPERKHNIRLDMYFIQFDKSQALDVGIRWPASFGNASFSAAFDFLEPGFVQAAARVVNQPLPALDLAQTNGWARVLKHSTVIAANGSQASFSSGGEQNFRITSGLVAELRQLGFGTKLDVLPRFDPVKRELEVKVEADISDLTPPVAAATDLPGRNVTHLNTQVTLKIGQALVLSGIHTQGTRSGHSGLPGLSSLPILGALFGAQLEQSEEVEGAVYLVPSVVEAMPKRERELVNELIDAYENYDGDIEGEMRPGFTQGGQS